jgi:flagellar hook assembly protein FlgD
MNHQLQAGDYTVLWNGKDNSGNQVAGGVYLYMLNAGGFKAQKKMTLLK